MSQEQIDQLAEELAHLRARVTNVESRQTDLEGGQKKLETTVLGVENKVELFKNDLGNQSRWLQELSEKLDQFGRTSTGVKTMVEAMTSQVTGLHKFVTDRTNELVAGYQKESHPKPPAKQPAEPRDTLPAPALDDTYDIHEETTVTGVPKPAHPHSKV